MATSSHFSDASSGAMFDVGRAVVMSRYVQDGERLSCSWILSGDGDSPRGQHQKTHREQFNPTSIPTRPRSLLALRGLHSAHPIGNTLGASPPVHPGMRDWESWYSECLYRCSTPRQTNRMDTRQISRTRSTIYPRSRHSSSHGPDMAYTTDR